MSKNTPESNPCLDAYLSCITVCLPQETTCSAACPTCDTICHQQPGTYSPACVQCQMNSLMCQSKCNCTRKCFATYQACIE